MSVVPCKGGGLFIWGLPVVLIGQSLVALVFAELSVVYPMAGSLYQWARRLVGPRYGWLVGTRRPHSPGKTTKALRYKACRVSGARLTLGMAYADRPRCEDQEHVLTRRSFGIY